MDLDRKFHEFCARRSLGKVPKKKKTDVKQKLIYFGQLVHSLNTAIIN